MEYYEKKTIGLFISLLILFSFLFLNLYTGSNSFPGYGGNADCNLCHNQLTFVRNVDVSFALNDYITQFDLFTQYAQWTSNQVPVIPTNNRSANNLDFIRMFFLKNSTDVMIMAIVPDSTPTSSNVSSAFSDKFGIVFNIDVVNFTIGSFLSAYNGTQTDIKMVLSGQMAFTNGHADLWYLDVGKTGYNTTGTASDMFITTGILSDGST